MMCLPATPPMSVAGPLVVTKPDVTIGEVNTNKPALAVFQLENAGKQPLTIRQVSRSCSCVKIDLGQEILKPGEQTRLTMAFNVLTQPEGLALWQSKIAYSLDGEQTPREQQLTVRAMIKKDVWVEPVSLVLIGEKDMTGSISVFDRRGKKLNVTNARIGLDHVDVAFQPNTKDSTRQIVQITSKPELFVGTHQDEVIIKTDDPDFQELRVPVRLIKQEPVARVKLFPLKTKLTPANLNQLVRVQDRDEEPVVIESVESNVPWLTAKWASGQDGDATIRLTAAEHNEDLIGLAVVTVKLSNPVKMTKTILVEWKK